MGDPKIDSDTVRELSDEMAKDKLSSLFSSDFISSIEKKLNSKNSDPEKDFLKDVELKSFDIAIMNKVNGDYIYIQQDDEYGWDYTSYTKDFREIDGGVADDIPATKETDDIRIAAREIVKNLYPGTNLSDWTSTDVEALQSKVEEVEEDTPEEIEEDYKKLLEEMGK